MLDRECATDARRHNRLAVIGLAAIVGFVVFCFLGPLVYHPTSTSAQLMAANKPPGTPNFPLGSTNTGYDMLHQLMLGGRASLLIGVGAALLASAFGTLWGAVAGYVGGPVDALMMRIVDAFLSIPLLFVLLFLSRLTTPSVPSLTLGIAAFAWLGPARLVRGETLTLGNLEFVQAVKGMGGGNSRIIVRHVLPNAVGTIVVNATFQVADAILAPPRLSYSASASPPHAEWGGLLAGRHLARLRPLLVDDRLPAGDRGVGDARSTRRRRWARPLRRAPAGGARGMSDVIAFPGHDTCCRRCCRPLARWRSFAAGTGTEQ